MTLVNTETGELLDTDAAEKRAVKIGLDLDGAADRFEAAMEKMRAAIHDRDDLALGYRSPGDYLSDRFGGKLARLGVDLRREVVRELTDAGLSTRAIAPVVDVSHKTIVKDLQVVPEVPPETEPAPVIGIDGKKYPRAERMRPVQRDKAETYLNLIEMQAAKAAREVQNLTPDQIRRVRPKADQWTVGLRNSIEVLQHLVDSLDHQENK